MTETPLNAKQTASDFAGYLSSQSIPVARANMRKIEGAAVTMALVDHAPNPGNWFDPIEEVVVSVVLHAERSTVVRDFGEGRSELRYGSGLVLVSPPSRAAFWRFEGHPLILHISFPLSLLTSLLETEAGTASEDLVARAARTPRHDALVAQIAARMWGSSSTEFASPLATHALGTILSLTLDQTEPPAAKTTMPQWKLQRALATIRDQKQRVRVSSWRRSLACQRITSSAHSRLLRGSHLMRRRAGWPWRRQSGCCATQTSRSRR